MDAVMGTFGFTILYIFPRSETDALPFDLERLHASFQALVEDEYRILLGELHVDPKTGVVSVKQTPEVVTPGASRDIPFEKVASNSADSEGITTDVAMASLSMEFMSKREANQLVTIKATLLSDGGLALGVNMTHTLLDGEGMFTFMKVWGEFYRNVPKQERTVVCHDRTLLSGKGVGAKLEHPEFKLKAPAPESAPAPAPEGEADSVPATAAPVAFPSTTQHVFHISPAQMKQIKATAMSSLEEGYVSTTDALTALFIILISQARGHGQDVRFTTGVNARKRFSPPLPENYVGNVIFNAFSAYEARELEALSEKSIGRVAKRVRQSILERDDTFLRDAIEFVTSNDNLSDVLVGTNFFFGPDLMFTSWANFGMYDADFGSRPWYAGVPKLPLCDGMMVFMEGIKGSDGLDLVVLLETQAMQRLLALWEQVPFWN